MKKNLIAMAVAASLVAPMAAQAKPEVKWFGFAQILATSKSQNVNTPPSTIPDYDGFIFGADRVRIGFKLKDGPVFGKLQIDFNKTDSGNPQDANGNAATLPQIIKDAVVGYKFSNAAKISAGQFKTPLGMDFNISGKKLDIAQRGMEKKLVLERAAGVMLSGRKIAGGFGYDIFYGNPSSRSSAVDYANDAIVGNDNTTVFRVMYDMGKMLHVEASTGTSTSSIGTEKDYKVTDFAVAYKGGPLTVKAEYIKGTDIRGTDGRDETVWYLHGGYAVNKTVELVVRHYAGKADAYGSNPETDITNTYLGVNLFLGSTKTNGRVQLNYVMTGGDDAGSATPYTGIAANYTDNAILAQYQMSF